MIELPVLWATASAEYFAMAGVTLFEKMGCVDGICFGAETDNLKVLSQIADVLVAEPDHYRVTLSSYLKEGLAFPVARSKALCEYLGASDDVSSILNEPNNILAIEYLKALKRRGSSMKPHVLKREGAGYHDEAILDATNFSDAVPTASATAIRKMLADISANSNQPVGNDFTADVSYFEKLASAMPASALETLKAYSIGNVLLQPNDFSSILGYKLLTSDVGILSDIGDSNPDVSNRLFKNRMNFSSFEQFCELSKSKDVTYTRISRILLHLILNITSESYLFGKELDYVPYLRMLGFRKDASALLKELKNTATAPIISKLADASSLLSDNAMVLLEKDIFAADLYSQTCANKLGTTPQSEYTRNIVII